MPCSTRCWARPCRSACCALRSRARRYLQRLAAGIAIALVCGAAASRIVHRARTPGPGLDHDGVGHRFCPAPAVAHAVYSPEQRRPVEVDAAHEDQLVAWLSKRMGAPMKPPHLQTVGCALEGGRLLPGRQGPVAQFMYRDESGTRLTLYVSNEVGDLTASASAPVETDKDTAFRFAREGKVNVFYWIEGPFGYAISADADQAVLARVSGEVYRQLIAGRRWQHRSRAYRSALRQKQ